MTNSSGRNVLYVQSMYAIIALHLSTLVLLYIVASTSKPVGQAYWATSKLVAHSSSRPGTPISVLSRLSPRLGSFSCRPFFPSRFLSLFFDRSIIHHLLHSLTRRSVALYRRKSSLLDSWSIDIHTRCPIFPCVLIVSQHSETANPLLLHTPASNTPRYTN
jgi:hypothetical protein